MNESTFFSRVAEFKMKKIVIILLFLTFSTLVRAQDIDPDAPCPSWAKKICRRWNQILGEGNTDLFFSGYSWHNRYAYTEDRLKTYNELAWGGGLGREIYDENGDWHGLFAIVFLDSHKNPEPAIGYTFLKEATYRVNTHLGAGYTFMITSRPDYANGCPFPALLPVVSAGFHNLTVFATYVPSIQRNVGNVLFINGKWALEGIN